MIVGLVNGCLKLSRRMAVGRSRWSTLLICCCLTAACALQPLPRDLATYLNRDVYAIVELEKIALRSYGAHTGENFISDQDLRRSLDEEIIPAYRRFADLATRIEPRTEAIRRLHALYRKAAALRLRGFRMVVSAIDIQDRALIRQANGLLRQGHAYVVQWQTQVASLADEYGMTFNSQ